MSTPVITAAEYRALAFRDEEAFLQHVLALAKWGGWMPFHVRRSKGSHPGFPDLVLTRPGRLYFAELKMPAGRLTPAQRDWQAMLRTVAAETDGCVQVHEWRPADLDAIERLLIGDADGQEDRVRTVARTTRTPRCDCPEASRGLGAVGAD